MRNFGGQALLLDRSDINTDEIIPARHLTKSSKGALKEHCLEDLKLEGFDPHKTDFDSISVIISRENFGCGSSREHAPWVFEVNGIQAIIAESYARIFRQNMFNCGLLAIELSKEDIDRIFILGQQENVTVAIDIDSFTIVATAGHHAEKFKFLISPFDEALVKAGGWVEFADSRY